eukprot:296568-Pyramimonas_sp.AAC.1
MSDDVLGSLLLGHAGLSPLENMTALTSAGNSTTFHESTDVLIVQRARVHVRQEGKGESGKGSSSST